MEPMGPKAQRDLSYQSLLLIPEALLRGDFEIKEKLKTSLKIEARDFVGYIYRSAM
jgi:hypothetical protein